MIVRSISIVAPFFNEAAVIDEFYYRVAKMTETLPDRDFEFIFVNDGSTDETATLLNGLAKNDKRVRVLHFARNRGHQIALFAGLDWALGDMIVTIDADLQDPPELVPEMLEKIESGFDIVHAKRFRRPAETAFKLGTAWIYYKLLRWFSKTPIIENSGDFRAFTHRVADVVANFRTPFKFLRGMFAGIGFSQSIVSYNRAPRQAGETKFTLLKMINFAIDGILGFSAAPIRIMMWLSLILWGISLVYLVKALIGHFILKVTVAGWTSIIFLQFFFTGLILFCLSVIGSYVGRIFIQGQKSPLYWLEDAKNLDMDRVIQRRGSVPEVELSRRILEKDREDA